MSGATKLRVYIPTKHIKVNEGNVHPDVDSAIALFVGETSAFDVKVILFDPTCDKEYDKDYQMVCQALRMSKEADCKAFTIVCKETSISSSSSQQIFKLIEDAITLHKSEAKRRFDILWLADWLDRCDQFTNIQQIGSRGAFIADTVSPHGIQCLMFSPEGREKYFKMEPVKAGTITLSGVLNRRTVLRTNADCESEKNIRFISRVIEPCPVTFDVRRAKSDIEYAKCSACVDPPGPVKPNKTGSDIGFFIFIVIGAVIITAIIILVKFGNSMSNKLAAAQSSSAYQSLNVGPPISGTSPYLMTN